MGVGTAVDTGSIILKVIHTPKTPRSGGESGTAIPQFTLLMWGSKRKTTEAKTT